MVTKTRRTDDDILNELRAVESAPAPESTKKDDVLRRGDEETDRDLGDTTMVVAEVNEAGYAYIYDVKSGIRSTVLKYLLPDYLRRRHPDGSRVFTADKQRAAPLPARPFKCHLTESAPDRAKYATWGFPICEQTGFVSAPDRDMHMQRKHKSQWEKIQLEETKAREEQRLKLEQKLVEAQLRAAKAMEKANRSPRKKRE